MCQQLEISTDIEVHTGTLKLVVLRIYYGYEINDKY